MNKFLPALIMTLGVYAFGSQEVAKNQEVDHLVIATMMIYDGKYDIAQSEIDQVEISAPGFDAAKYHTIKGTLASKTDKHAIAVQEFQKAIDATQKSVYVAPKAIDETRKYLFSIGSSKPKETTVVPLNPEFETNKQAKIERLYANLSQSYYKLKEYQKSVEALDKSGENGRNKAGLYAYRADCYWKSGDASKALNALSTGYDKFTDPALLKQKYYYLSELKLYRSAIDASKEYMAKVGKKDEDYLQLGQMLMQANQTNEAIAILEEGKLLFPSNPSFGVMLTHAYLKKNMPHNSAALMESSALQDPKYYKDSVEMFRRNKDYSHALYLNLHVMDQKENIKQKVAMHLERGEFEHIIGLKDAMVRNGMQTDENMVYTLAYAYYMAGDYKQAEVYLQSITDNELFAKATIIRKNMEKCQANPRECVQ